MKLCRGYKVRHASKHLVGDFNIAPSISTGLYPSDRSGYVTDGSPPFSTPLESTDRGCDNTQRGATNKRIAIPAVNLAEIEKALESLKGSSDLALSLGKIRRNPTFQAGAAELAAYELNHAQAHTQQGDGRASIRRECNRKRGNG